jgi:cyclohexyl-isocyanide hydratase
MKKCIGILVFDEVDELDFIGVFEVLHKAAAVAGCDLFPVLIGLKKKIRDANGLVFQSEIGIAGIKECRALVIPGGKGIHLLKDHGKLKSLIYQARERMVPIYTVCSGIFLLAYLGLIRHRTVCVHHAKRQDLLNLCDCFIEKGLVRDGTIVSAGGDEAGKTIKSIQIGYEILKDFFPQAIPHAIERLKIGRHP